MPTLDEIDLRILGTAYEWWYSRFDEVPHLELIAGVARAMEHDRFFAGIPDLNERLERLQHFNLLTDDGHCYLILPAGGDAVERVGTAPADLCARVRQWRNELLQALVVLYRSRGRHSVAHYSTLATELSIGSNEAFVTLFQMSKAGLVESDGQSGSYRISQDGLAAVAESAAARERSDEFHRLSGLEPHPRGRSLQKYLAGLFASQDWHVDEGATTEHEEMDVVLSRGREYYLVECKWEKEPSKAGYVRELRGKLESRVDVRGILASMSGFTRGAASLVRECANARVILLFGPRDIESMVSGEVTFEDLLDEKYRKLIVFKLVVVDGEVAAE